MSRASEAAGTRRVPWYRLAAGALAGSAALALTFLLRLSALGVFLPEVALDFVVEGIPAEVETAFIRTMGEGAKVLGLLTALAAAVGLSAAYALPFRWLQGRLRHRAAVLGAVATGYAALALLVALPLLGGGVLGGATAAGPGAATFSQLLAGALYAAVLDHLLVEVVARHPEGFRPSRRQFLAGVVAVVAAAALTLYGLGQFVARTGRLAFRSVAELFAREVTPTEEFYVVSKNLVDPAVDAASWGLVVDGLVGSPRTYGYEELQARVDAEEAATLECVSNEVGGNLISTARWQGLRLRDLLADTGPEAAADWVLLSCADGYDVAIPRARADEEETLLALRMNGEPLPANHGFPARVVAPGLYGMFSAKWVTRITLLRGEYLGFWQRKGWTNRGAVRGKAFVAVPPPESAVEGPVTLGGVAFTGDRGVSAVEVSTDGGVSWSPAELRRPPLSDLTWVLWTRTWEPTRTGSHQVVARLVDGAGRPQEATAAAPFPDGAAGYDRVTLHVVG